MRHIALVLTLTAAASFALAETGTLTPSADAPVSPEQGLAAWARIYEVTSHPRCSNCHVGPSNTPMWSGPSYGPNDGKTRPHGMNINAGDSRIGAEYILCSTCHTTSDRSNDAPHQAPRVAAVWQLAPVEAEWFGQSSDSICNQLRDPARNGGRSFAELADHLGHDVILHWAWSPGGAREPAPYSLPEHINDIRAWGAAGQPCPGD